MKKFNNMAELAAHLGLSRSTVSYILNDKWRERNISAKTAKRVRDFAEQVQFTPNFLGLAISGKISIDVAILIPDDLFDHHKQAFFDFLDMISANHMRHMVFQIGSDERETRRTIEDMQSLRVSRAIIFAPAVLGAAADFDWWRQIAVRYPGMEFLFYDYRSERTPAGFSWPPNVCTVGFDADAALEMTMEFIAATGYRQLYWFHIQDKKFAALAKKHGIELIFEFSTVAGSLSTLLDCGRKIGDKLATEVQSSTVPAIFIGDDVITVAAIDRLLELGRRVPEELAFISWDGLKISRYFRRALTTVEMPHAEMLSFAEHFVTGNPGERHCTVKPFVRIGESLPAGSGAMQSAPGDRSPAPPTAS